MPECSCRGTNPNCCQCGGTGYVSRGKKSQIETYTYAPAVQHTSRATLPSPSPTYQTLQKQKKGLIKKGVIRLSLKKKKFLPTVPVTTCPICGVRVRRNRIEKHKQKVHAHEEESFSSQHTPDMSPKDNSDSHNATSKQPMTRCPICHVCVRVDRLKKHQWKVHNKQQNLPETKTELSRTTRHSSLDSGKKSQSDALRLEQLYQSRHEPRFANKYLGQMRRDWNGTFGSLPLYDDYGDESVSK